MATHFRACGLSLAADCAIPGLAAGPAGAPADVHIMLGILPPGLPRAAHPGRAGGKQSGRPEPITWHSRAHGGFLMGYDDGTVFVVSACGSRIWAVWPDTLTLEDTAVYLLGPVLALVLRLKGVTCLHASALCIDHTAVVLAGPSGVGKSTTAAALAARGHGVIADDLLALESRKGVIRARPGCSRLRLWPDGAGMVYGPERTLPRLTPNWEKRYVALGGRLAPAVGWTKPLSAVYLLEGRRDDPDAPFVEPLSGATGLLSLLANTRGDFYPDPVSRQREFELLGRMGRQVPLRRVVPSTDPNLLPRLCDVILEDLASQRGAATARERSCTT